MATELYKADDVDFQTSTRALIIVWQDPSSRRFVKVGRIDVLEGGRFAFQYLPTAFENNDFNGVDEFPERGAVYVSDEMPAFFSNRVLSSDRRDYDTYLEWLGIDSWQEQDIPLEVLARTGGGRATDTFHVVDLPVNTDERFSSRFFVSGIRYFDGASSALETLEAGTELALSWDEANSYNPKAILVRTADGQNMGYVPDWLCGDVHDRMAADWHVRAVVEQVNSGAPAHLRLLCHIIAEP